MVNGTIFWTASNYTEVEGDLIYLPICKHVMQFGIIFTVLLAVQVHLQKGVGYLPVVSSESTQYLCTGQCELNFDLDLVQFTYLG